MSAYQTVYYFGEHLPVYGAQIRASRLHPDADDAVVRSVDFPKFTHIYLISQIRVDQGFYHGMMSFFSFSKILRTVATADFDERYIETIPCGVDLAFYIESRDTATLALLKRYFYLRAGVGSPFEDVPPAEQFILFYSPDLPGSERAFNRRCG